MTSTLTDVIVRNVSLQATNRLNEDTIKDYEKTVEALDAEIGRLNQSGSDTVTELQLEIARLNDELNSIRNLKSEYENVRSQVQHVDTFRNQLISARKENETLREDYENKIKELNEKIDYLQMTPAKRKKYDELKSQEVSSTNVRDGGSF